MKIFSNSGAIFGGALARPAADDMAALQAEVLALHDALHGRLLRYAVSFGLSRHDGEDILQEVFLALFRHLQAGRSRDNLPGWAYRTTHNLSLKRRASLHAEARIAVDDAELEVHDHQPDPEAHALFYERQQHLRAVVNALPETDRMCLHLRADGLRYRDIAATLDVSLGTVAACLARAFARLQRAEERR